MRSFISVSASASEICSEFAEQHTGPGTFLLPLGGHFGVVRELWQGQAFFSGTVWDKADIVGSRGNSGP